MTITEQGNTVGAKSRRERSEFWWKDPPPRRVTGWKKATAVREERCGDIREAGFFFFSLCIAGPRSEKK